MILGVTAVPPADDLAVLAQVQGVLIEVLESRNAALDIGNGELARLGTWRSGWRGWRGAMFPQFRQLGDGSLVR